MRKILENYPLFYDILFTTTMLSNSNSKVFIKDAKKVIDFFGAVYKLDQETIDHYSKVILENLISTATIKDYDVLCNFDINIDDDNLVNMINIKCNVLKDLNLLSAAEKKSTWFNYSFVALYTAESRFKQINDAAIEGNLYAARTIGILYALGIGCSKNIKKAILRIKQCVYWGDLCSTAILPYLYELNGEKEKAELYTEVHKLSAELLNEGITVVPIDLKSIYSKESQEIYAIISSIKYDIIAINCFSKIIYSFVEVMVMEGIDFKTKMSYINNFKSFSWQEASNTTVTKQAKLGFLGK